MNGTFLHRARGRRTAFALSCGLCLAGCTSKPEPAQPWTGTSWAMGGTGAAQPAPGPGPAEQPQAGSAAGATPPPTAGMAAVPQAGTAGMEMPVAGQNAAAGAPAPGGDAGLGPEPEPTADAGGMEPEPMPREDLGEGDGSDVVTIGDSWMSNTLGTGDGIEGALSRLTGQPYRNYAVQGVMLLQTSLFGPAIPTQYARAKAQDPDIVTVIMTGGGNDIIQNPTVQASCNQGGEACVQKLMEISAALNTLWTEMANDGVQDVIYIRYARDAGSTDDSVRGGGEVPAICLSGRIRCHSIDTTDAVMGQLQDGIHPTRAANDRIAKQVYDYMVAKGIRR